ncbi:hypothetical protein CLF_109592 [Clonorchis sinensis]|uniref:Endonuclease/exonuclease/phosphatase domain-containing protein n=1 Tax=Clonorchis sinensis TaxID=79923 RepID=G7YSR9_CLOSI|nr:hypothetical protein CLF_109592 [Clonorchis sinensis]
MPEAAWVENQNYRGTFFLMGNILEETRSNRKNLKVAGKNNARKGKAKSSLPEYVIKTSDCRKYGTRITNLERQQNCHDLTDQYELKHKTVTEASWPWAVGRMARLGNKTVSIINSDRSSFVVDELLRLRVLGPFRENMRVRLELNEYMKNNHLVSVRSSSNQNTNTACVTKGSATNAAGGPQDKRNVEESVEASLRQTKRLTEDALGTCGALLNYMALTSRTLSNQEGSPLDGAPVRRIKWTFAAALTEVVQQSAWTQHVVAPTRYRAGQQPSLLDLVITNERHFVDQVTINAPLGHSDHCVLTFDFICYWARNPEPQTWIRNFCRADFSGMRIFLDQVKLGPASVEDLYRTIVQKVHEADAMFVPKKPARSRMSRKLPKRIRRLLEKRSQLFFKKLTTGDTEDELAFRKMRNRCKSEIRQWNIRKQATILDLARKNRNVLFKYMRHRRRNKPSRSPEGQERGTHGDPIVVSEFYRDHYAGLIQSQRPRHIQPCQGVSTNGL